MNGGTIWAQCCAWKRWLDAILAFFYPEHCQICREERATASEGYVCRRCGSSPGGVRWITPPFCERCGLPYEGAITTKFECANCREMRLHFSSARAAVAATPLVLDVIHRYKYRGGLWFEPFLANLLVSRARLELRPADWDFLIPIPLHPLKKREREFNQAERLARHLSVATGIPVLKRLMFRRKATRTQTQLSRRERTANVRTAFEFQRKQRLNGERIVLVDDVMTTGATTSACAKVLMSKGAGTVSVWTVARGLWN